MMDTDGPPKRVVLALRDTSQVESRAALHWALNTLPVRPGVDYVLLFHVVKCMRIISDGRLGLPYAAAGPHLRSSIRQLAMVEGAREMHHYVQVCAHKYVLADVQLSFGDRLPSIVQAVEDCQATHLIMGTRKTRGHLKHLWKGTLTDRVAKAVRCSVFLVNRRAQLETTHVYNGERGLVGTHLDGSMIVPPEASPRCRLMITRSRDGPTWQHPGDELSPEAITAREDAAARIQSEVDTWRRKWAATHSLPPGSAGSKTGAVDGSREHGTDCDNGQTVEEETRTAVASDGTAGSGGPTAGGGSLTAGEAQDPGRAIQAEGSLGGSQRFWDDGLESDVEDEEGVPSLFVCCISQDIMSDPVIAADGNTYERTQITQWLRRKATSPLTNLPLSDRGLIPNISLKEAIKQWTEHRQRCLPRAGG
ncbi:U box domain containing protein [Klebsormidium nitens]|uniref:U box domain containing protein n=1 Tax=Klebsormidium nitens TaxID=105231 RepID=A0A1Y1II40_KLENI|nr:U box domain containing protein [Klebsormidium nitens]|eukprot:GAQ88317.1 U box domain containing protein [Klebsormidium nitens]